MARYLTSLEESKAAILKYVAEYAPKHTSDPRHPNRYLIKQHAHAGSQPTVLAAVDELEEEDSIKPVDIDKDARGLKPSKHYRLSLRGLLQYLSSFKKAPDPDRAVDAALTKHPDLLPSIFEIWPSFNKVKPLRAKRLIQVSEHALSIENRQAGTGVERWTSEDFLINFMIPFRMQVLWPLHMLETTALPVLDLEWFHSLSEHEDLKKLMLSWTEKMVKRQINRGRELSQDLVELSQSIDSEPNTRTFLAGMDSAKRADGETSNPSELDLLRFGADLMLKASRNLEALLAENLLYHEPMKALESIEQTFWDAFRVVVRHMEQIEAKN
jgi:hypothetical protein